MRDTDKKRRTKKKKNFKEKKPTRYEKQSEVWYVPIDKMIFHLFFI